MTYEAIRRRLLGASFVLGPLLLVTSALVLIANVGRNPGAMSWGSGTEGVIGYFGFILLVPVFLALADHLGHYRPRLAALAAVTALIGFAGGGVMNMTLRAIVPDLLDAGVNVAMFDDLYANFERGDANLLPLLATGPLTWVSALILGVGFLLARVLTVPAWLLIAGGVLLPVGQLLLIATDLTYTLSLVLWALALVPLGLRLLRGWTLAGAAEAPMSPVA